MGEDCPQGVAARDRRLLEAWREGDAELGLQLMEHYHKYYLSLCWRYGVRDESEQLDLYQELLVRLLGVLPRLELRSSFAGYLRRVFHTAVRETRVPARLSPLPAETAASAEAPSRRLVGQEIVAAVEECAEHLPERERAVFVARILEERAFADLAAESALSLGNLHVIYHRARVKMRSCLEKKGFSF